MKKLLVLVALVGMTVPFAKMVYEMASTSKQHEVGISSSQVFKDSK